jgi:hypothetical protein
MTKNREKQNKKRKDRKKAALAQEDQDPVGTYSIVRTVYKRDTDMRKITYRATMRPNNG